MTSLAPTLRPDLAALRAAAGRAGLAVVSSACWPETDADREVRPLAGFIESSFSPLLAEVANRAMGRREPAPGRVTAIVMVTALGDVTSATRVARAVDTGRRVFPLMFFQSVPNAVAGYLAARWHLTGPVACVGGIEAGLDAAALLIEDADADEALVLWAEVAVTRDDRDLAAAVLVTGPGGPGGPGTGLPGQRSVLLGQGAIRLLTSGLHPGHPASHLVANAHPAYLPPRADRPARGPHLRYQQHLCPVRGEGAGTCRDPRHGWPESRLS